MFIVLIITATATIYYQNNFDNNNNNDNNVGDKNNTKNNKTQKLSSLVYAKTLMMTHTERSQCNAYMQYMQLDTLTTYINVAPKLRLKGCSHCIVSNCPVTKNVVQHDGLVLCCIVL